MEGEAREEIRRLQKKVQCLAELDEMYGVIGGERVQT